MAIKLSSGKFACPICYKAYPQASRADDCKTNHNVVYIPFTHTELNRLIHSLQFGDSSLISEELWNKLRDYARTASKQKDGP